jgi:hypothetical protein
MYGPKGCDYCGGDPWHRITCPMLRWLVLGGFAAALTSILLVLLLTALGVTGFGGVDWPFAALATAAAATGMLVYKYRQHRKSVR